MSPDNTLRDLHELKRNQGSQGFLSQVGRGRGRREGGGRGEEREREGDGE